MEEIKMPLNFSLRKVFYHHLNSVNKEATVELKKSHSLTIVKQKSISKKVVFYDNFGLFKTQQKNE